MIVGPGAMGCLLATRLHLAGCRVHLVARNTKSAKRLAASGISVRFPDHRSKTIHLPVSTAEHAPLAPLVCLCVKAYDTKHAVLQSRHLIARGGGMILFQNGDCAAMASRALKNTPLICSTTSFGAYRTAPGHVTCTRGGIITVAPFRASASALARSFVRLLRRAELPVAYTERAPEMIWKKLILNAGINPVTSLAKIRNGALLKRRDLMNTACTASQEALDIAIARRFLTTRFCVRHALETLCINTADNISSMLQDIHNRRCTESRWINGAVCREAKEAGIPAPVNARLLRQIRKLEA